MSHNDNGRARDGTFAKGNPGGPGRPGLAEWNRQAGEHRARFYAALRDNDCEKALAAIREVMNDKKAKPNERLAAAGELLDRVLGKSVPSDLLARIEALEQAMTAQSQEDKHAGKSWR